jgi:spermidine/putrescine transport system permease protein
MAAAGAKEHKIGERPKPGVFIAPALLWTAVFFVLPFIAMATVSLWTLSSSGIDHSPSFSNYSEFFRNPSYFQAMINSLEVTGVVILVSILLAYPFAWILAEWVPERWQRLGLILAILPFWTSYVVRSYSWLLVLAEKGIINNSLVSLGLLNEPIQLANTRFATILGFVHFFVMLLTLTIYANLRQLPVSYRRAAADLGATRLQTFIYVILPLSLPGIVVGAFLAFVLAMGDYITPQILGGNNELLMPQLIMMQIGRRGDFPLASALSLILMAVVTIGYIAAARWLRLERA